MVGAGDSCGTSHRHGGSPGNQYMIQAHNKQRRPGESWPGPVLAGVRTISKACHQEFPERPVISTGVEIPGHHLRLIDGSQRLLDHRSRRQLATRPWTGASGFTASQRHRKPAQWSYARPRRSGSQTRDRLERSQRPARPQAGAWRTGPGVEMRKRKYLGKPDRCQPGNHERGQFLDSEYIHVVLVQNAKDGGRVSRAAPGVHGEQAQPERCCGRSRSARWPRFSLETSPPEHRQLPHHQQRGGKRKQSHQPPGRVSGDDHGGDRGHHRQRGKGRQFRVRIRRIPARGASGASSAKIMRIKAVTQVTPCLFSPGCRCG